MSNAPKARFFLPLLQEPSYPLHETGRGGVDFPDAFLDALPKFLHPFFDLFVAAPGLPIIPHCRHLPLKVVSGGEITTTSLFLESWFLRYTSAVASWGR